MLALNNGLGVLHIVEYGLCDCLMLTALHGVLTNEKGEEEFKAAEVLRLE